SDRVAVMYLGRIVEVAPKQSLYEHSLHPYTQALLSSIPVIHSETDTKENTKRTVLSGDLPSPANPPSGCTFRTRCPFAFETCSIDRPELIEIEKDHYVACHLYTDDPVN
ncbi:MAG TPA: oligopeptide/dipeptide ABC transporter ATP-binding protein, partial [Virgibacillus sp.]|nr:oligopeptide/dipeptide ABC transporter ATP-binding protein [Virgibacillus sp.]